MLAATQSPGEAGMNWFQGTADAVRQFTWLFEVCSLNSSNHSKLNCNVITELDIIFISMCASIQSNRRENIEYIVILSGDQLYRMDYMDFVQACHRKITNFCCFLTFHMDT